MSEITLSALLSPAERNEVPEKELQWYPRGHSRLQFLQQLRDTWWRLKDGEATRADAVHSLQAGVLVTY